MSTLAYTVSDSTTMLRRNLRRAVRYPMITYLIALPVIFLVLFVYVFGGTLGAGLAGEHVFVPEYVVPGVLLLTVAGGVTARRSRCPRTSPKASSRASARWTSRAPRCSPAT